jgi:hypothetical protein
MSTRREIYEAHYRRYQRAGKKEKGKILDEAAGATGSAGRKNQLLKLKKAVAGVLDNSYHFDRVADKLDGGKEDGEYTRLLVTEQREHYREKWDRVDERIGTAQKKVEELKIDVRSLYEKKHLIKGIGPENTDAEFNTAQLMGLYCFRHKNISRENSTRIVRQKFGGVAGVPPHMRTVKQYSKNATRPAVSCVWNSRKPQAAYGDFPSSFPCPKLPISAYSPVPNSLQAPSKDPILSPPHCSPQGENRPLFTTVSQSAACNNFP